MCVVLDVVGAVVSPCLSVGSVHFVASVLRDFGFGDLVEKIPKWKIPRMAFCATNPMVLAILWRKRKIPGDLGFAV